MVETEISPQKSISVFLSQEILDQLHHKRNYWKDPPDFRLVLYGTILVVLLCSVVLACVGHILSTDPGILIQAYLESNSGNQSHSGRKVCHHPSVDLCPTDPGLDSRFFVLEHWTEIVARVFGAVGISDIVISISVLIFAATGKTRCLFATLFIIPFVIAAKWELVDIVVFPMSPMHESVQNELVEKFRKVFEMNSEKLDYLKMHSSDPNFTTMNSIMVTFGCCGILEPQDFKYNAPVLFIGNTKSVFFYYPPACCSRPKHDLGPGNHLEFIIHEQCISKKNMTWDVNSVGCFPVVFNYVYQMYGRFMLILLLTGIHIQALQFVFTILVLLKRKRGKQKGKPTIVSRAASLRSRPSIPEFALSKHIIEQNVKDQRFSPSRTQVESQTQFDSREGSIRNEGSIPPLKRESFRSVVPDRGGSTTIL